MAEQKLVDAVREVQRSTQQFVIKDAAEKALADGSNEALTRALIYTRETSQTWYAKKVADRALGFE